MSDFNTYSDQFEESVFRLETLQAYAEDDSFRAFREGKPQPERSVRSSPWMARIALTTLAGKRWSRVHVIDHPLSDYLHYELRGYVQSEVVGEQISLTDRAAHPELTRLRSDFWLFDAETDHAYALLMRYAPDGSSWLGFDYADDRETLDRCRSERDLAMSHSTALNVYLAGARQC